MYYAVQSIHFNDRAPSLFWLSKSTAITTEYNFTHTIKKNKKPCKKMKAGFFIWLACNSLFKTWYKDKVGIPSESDHK